MLLLILLQAAAAQTPDIELNLHARARSVEIQQKGEARLEVTGDANGSRVETRVEPKAQGRTRLRNVSIDVRAQASVTGGGDIQGKAETASPQ